MQAMAISLRHIQLDALIAQAQVNDRELGEILGVNQSTAWRLRNGHIKKVEPYLLHLRKHLGVSESANGDDDARLIADLVALSSRMPALRDALLAILRIMRETA
jgi:DNA-binding Xre family transcriptional regulator